MHQWINKPTVMVPSDWGIDQTLRLMIEKKVSSTLIYDKEDRIVGIVTERDVLRKISTLDMDRKLDHKINTIMSRPIHFADISSMEQDIKDLHRKFSLRHFPIKQDAAKPTRSSVLGIVTLTDIARSYFEEI